MNRIKTDNNNNNNSGEKTDKIVFLVIITGRKHKNAILSAVSEAGARLENIIYCKGTVKASVLLKSIGLAPEKEHVMITCAITCGKSEAVMQMLIETFHFNKPNTGMAFTIPINRLSF